MSNNIIVQKYGGSSMGDVSKIKNVARRIAEYYKKGYKVAVVVSAMGKTTDKLVKLAYEITKNPSKREMDMLLSTGEQISISLLAMALHNLNIDAISLTGLQVGINTDSAFTKAKILDIRTNLVKKHLKDKKVVIVAGFQGVDKDMNITTLGRGGSDTTAMALAAALKADLCEIYTDVDGVYTADPRIIKDAVKLDYITYDEMLEMASLGAKVMHSRAVEIAKRFDVKFEVKSSFKKKKGTIVYKEFKNMENLVVTGVTTNKSEAKVTIIDLPDKPGIAAKIFKLLSDNNINVNMIVQSSSQNKTNDISFTIDEADLNDAKKVISSNLSRLGGKEVFFDKNIGTVSIVGIGMRSHPGVAKTMFETLAKNKINIQMISTSEIKISCVINRNKVDTAAKALHKAFNLHNINKKRSKK